MLEEGIFDIHCHIVPGVDDGAADIEETRKLLEMEYKQGVRNIILTPHFRFRMFETPLKKVQRQFCLAEEAAADISKDLHLYLGCEFHANMEMLPMLREKKVSTMAGSRYVLVEFSHNSEASYIRERLSAMLSGGYRPIVAHIERYEATRTDLDFVEEIKVLFTMVSMDMYGVTVDYAFQDINDIPGSLPEGRTKPWGTGQAVLAAKNVLHTPFIVINADDYYGKEGFKAVHEYLVNGGKSCMAGFVLKNTLSDNGGVTRGICKMDDSNNLTKVDETKNIVKTENGAEADGVIIDIDSLVSMNMWGLTPDFLEVLEAGFKEFFETEVSENPLKSEYLIPTFIGELLEQDRISVKVLRSNDTWYGMTYKEDVKAVKNSFRKMLEDGMYKEDLFADL